MADAPAPSSGSGWGLFEIIAVVVLVVAVANALNKDKVAVNPDQANSNSAGTNTRTIGDCYFSILTPSKDQKVSTTTIPISGTFSNCTFNTVYSVAFVQVIDSKSNTLSEYTPIPKSSDGNFNTTITLSGDPSTKTGELILVPNIAQQQNTTHTLRVPLVFSFK